MPFTDRFALLILMGIIPVILASFIDAGIIAFIIYNAVIILLFLQDYRLTPKPVQLEVERICDEKFSMGAENEVILRLRNNSNYKLTVEMKDEIPAYFVELTTKIQFSAIPHQFTEAVYVVKPEKRGEFSFGTVHLRYKGVWGLCSRSGKFDLKKSYKVYPNIKDLRRYTLSALKKCQLQQGVKKIKSYGTGTEFESLREYSEGDDYRKINWLATARSDKLIVNTYENERNQQIFILLDASRVMNSEINYIKKLDYAVNSAFLLSDFAIKKGDNVGLMVFDDAVTRFIKPGKGMVQFQLIADNLYNVEEKFVTADFENALVYLNNQQKRRSLLCIFTELFNADEAVRLVKTLKSLAKNHIPLVITIKDTRLEEIAEKNVNELEDLFNKTASIKISEERAKAAQILSSAGIPAVDVAPDKLSIEVLNKYLQMKATMQI